MLPFSFHSLSATFWTLAWGTQAVKVVTNLGTGVGLRTGCLACEIYELGQVNESLFSLL